jgi:hypothetical protein
MMSASFIEVFQVLWAAAGGGFAWAEMNEADKEKDSINSPLLENEPPLPPEFLKDRNRIADKNIRVARVILIIQGILFTIGLWTWFSPPPPFLPDALMDPFARLTPAEIQTIIEGNRSAVRAKQISMTSISIILSWLSYRNRVTMLPVRNRVRRTDLAKHDHDGAGEYNMVGSVTLKEKDHVE